jgi:uncharacterized RDD family membrane protein YckC
MQDVTSGPDSTTGPTVHYAGFWARCFATILDTILQCIVIAPLLLYFFGMEALMDANTSMGNTDLYLSIGLMVVVVLFWKYKSATPGKMMMGLKVVDAQTFGPVPTGRLVLRYLAYYVSLLPLMLGFIWVAFDRRKRGFHDMIAKTVVVHGE